MDRQWLENVDRIHLVPDSGSLVPLTMLSKQAQEAKCSGSSVRTCQKRFATLAKATNWPNVIFNMESLLVQ